MRIPVATSLKSRDGTTTKDPKVVNGLIEPDGEEVVRVTARPGNSDLGLVRVGTAQGAYYFNGQIITVHGNTADRTTLPLANISIGSVAVRPVTITRTGGFATATVSAPLSMLGFVTGMSVTVAGATQPEYNGTFVIAALATTVFAFTYAVAGAPATPATGTITATPTTDLLFPAWQFADNGLSADTTGFLMLKGPSGAARLRSDWDYARFVGSGDVGFSYPGVTVPGVVFLDGYFFVMDANGVIWNCDLDADPGSTGGGAGGIWDATSFIKANKVSGAGVCLTRSVNYIVALKQFSTEVFYDAGNPAPGSPLSPVDNAFSLVGCASAASVAQVEGSLAFVSQTRSKGRSVHLMTGAQQQRVSTPDIERILDADDLATVYAFGCKLEGHVLYFLTLTTTNITLVYDATTKTWMQWSSLTAQTPVSITSLVRSGTTVTATFSGAHNLNDGDPLLIAGASPAAYNGVWQTSYVSATVATFQIFSSPTTPATGTITGAHYSETYFKFSHYVNAGGRDVLLHESDGHLYEILPSLHADAGVPFKVFNRTGTVDGGDTTQKPMARIVVVADTVDAYLMVRWSDDDCATFSKYQAVHLSLDRPRIRRCGTFRRRIVETCFVSSGNPLRIEALELEGAG